VSGELDLLDWKRRIFELYADVRAAASPEDGWLHWRSVREELFRDHPQSPHPGYAALDYFPYDPELRLLAEVEPLEDERREIAGSGASTTVFRRFGHVRLPFGPLEVYWLEGYGGGIFVPFADATSGRETYGGGRYLLDTVKGADLGAVDGRLVLDFNFAYNPSCSYDPRWVCPLPPPENRLASEVRAGECVI
jgi:uncharacterized protein (DUF1684 family)